MSRSSRTGQNATRQQRIAAQRAAERRRTLRNRLLIASGAVLVVIVVVVIFVVVKVTAKPPSAKTGADGPTGAALATVISETTSVPAATLQKVGGGSVTTPPYKIPGTPLTSGGKPEMLYIGAEYCPYCAFERWGMIVALSRFGTFSGLRTTRSSSIDVYPSSATWTFYGSHYTSRYLVLSSVEETTNVVNQAGTGYTPLQQPTAEQEAVISKYDAPPYVPAADKNAIPFVYFDGRYVISGASVQPTATQGKDWATIAASLKDPSNPVAQAIDGTANYITAAVCSMTGDQPASVCTPAVTGLQAKMVSASGG